ncbi:hypothetical protein ACFL2T_06225 [Elusimicrobiota bacterium]
MADDRYHFDHLIREIVVTKLSADPDAAHEAALIAKYMIVVGIMGTGAAGSEQPPEVSVRLITKGMIEGAIVVETDVAEAAVEILQKMADAAQEVSLDPADMMTWAMQGIADSMALLPAEKVSTVHDAIDKAFMGAGEVFSKLCSRSQK